jgi:hypothetical protein
LLRLATGIPEYPFIDPALTFATAHGHADHIDGTLLTFRTSWQPDL